MKDSMMIKDIPFLEDYLGESSDCSYIDADLEGLKNALIVLVVAKVNSTDSDRQHFDNAIESVGLTIANLLYLERSLKGIIWE